MHDEATVVALNETVRGKGGLQDTVHDLRREVAELNKFRSTIIGVVIAVNGMAPLVWHFILKP